MDVFPSLTKGSVITIHVNIMWLHLQATWKIEDSAPGFETPTYLKLWRHPVADLGRSKREQLFEDVTGIQQ